MGEQEKRVEAIAEEEEKQVEVPKGTKGSSSSAAKATPTRRFSAKVVEPHRLRGRPTTDEEISSLEELHQLTESAMLICRVGSTFEEPLDDDEPMVLTDGIGDLDNEATTGEMQFDGKDDDDNQEYNPDNDCA
ncbi:hypothetical protein HAX54_020567 [Datura stramonium]|uniref:Uncharacterized protein n=1 Tax=Datura stramonium TaxID=4076 RepID=A0ABS8S2J7_DATST|nr:hypothetical protein [Datura stramonium]